MRKIKLTRKVITLPNYSKQQVYAYVDTLREVRRKVSHRKERQLTCAEKVGYVYRTIAWKKPYQDSFDAELRWL